MKKPGLDEILNRRNSKTPAIVGPLRLTRILDEGVYDVNYSVLLEKVRIYGQRKDYSCGSASLKILLAYLGLRSPTEKTIRKIAHKKEGKLASLEGNGTKSENEGVGSLGIIHVVQYFKKEEKDLRGVIMHLREDYRKEILKSFFENNIPVMVNFQRPNYHSKNDGSWENEQPKYIPKHLGHFAVAMGFNKPQTHILLADPLYRKCYFIDYKVFEKNWYDPYRCDCNWAFCNV